MEEEIDVVEEELIEELDDVEEKKEQESLSLFSFNFSTTYKILKLNLI